MEVFYTKILFIMTVLIPQFSVSEQLQHVVYPQLFIGIQHHGHLSKNTTSVNVKTWLIDRLDDTNGSIVVIQA